MSSPERVDLHDDWEAMSQVDPEPKPPATAPDLSHDALTLEMGRRQWNMDARFVQQWHRWLFWDGTRWKRDEKLLHWTKAREYLRYRADEVLKWAEGVARNLTPAEAEKARAWAERKAEMLRHKLTVTAVEELARSNEASAAQMDEFDTDAMLLGTPGGTVDLRTGELRTARRGDMITRQTAVTPAEKGTQPKLWLAFLDEIFGGDQEIIDFIQRAAGYALTGQTNEHKLLFLYGTGRNGKSVFTNLLFWLLADYARKAPAETFLNTQNAGHPTDIAGMQGARLVLGSELPRGKTWDESVIKDLTGGDPMTARFMRGDFFDFIPQLKLFIAGNTQPSFRGVDEAIRSRVVLVPFNVTIPKEKRDTKLTEKLKDEGPEILRWCLEGADQWQRRGLDVPEQIEAASSEYFDAEDTVAVFLEEETTQDPTHFTPNADLHQRFTQWAEGQGLATWTATTLTKALAEKGMTPAKSNGRRGVRGLRLR